MDAMKKALEKAGFGEMIELPEGQRRRWLLVNGLVGVAPIKEVKLHLGLEKIGAVTVAKEVYVTRREN